MSTSLAELTTRIGRAIVSTSCTTTKTRRWTPSLEQTLHRLCSRNSLSPHLVSRVIDQFLLPHHSLALGFFNWASQQPGFAHNSATYTAILKSLSVSRQFSAIDSVLKKVKAQRITLDPSVYRSVITSLMIGKKTHNAFLAFSDVASVGRDIGPEACNSLLAALASEGYYESAQKVFDEMTLRGIRLSTLGFGVFIWRFCRNADLRKVLSMVDEMRRGNSDINGSIIAVLIIHGLCEASRESEAFWVLDELRNRNCKPDFMAYWVVAEAYRSNGSAAEREKVLKKKRKLGVAPRTNDYREFIFALISGRRIREAKELGEVIVRGKFPMEEDVLNVLIGSIGAIEPDTAILFLNYMVGKAKFPTLLTLRNLSKNLCKQGKTDEMLEVFQVLESHHYFKDLESNNTRVSLLCRAGRVREAYGVLQEMKKKGMEPDVSFYNCVMEACCREDLLLPAKKLWDEMFARGCDGNLKTYSILIQKTSQVGQVEEAHRLFHQMLEKGIKPDVTTYVSLVEGLCEERKIEAALEVFNKSVEQDEGLARTVLGTFTLCLCKAGLFEAASKLMRGVSRSVGDSECHAILLKGLADAGEVSLAAQHIGWISETSPSLLQLLSAELLAFLSSSSRPDPIIRILKSVEEKSSS